MICMFIGLMHMLCVAFGFNGFIKDFVMLFLAGYVEIGLVDLPLIMFSGTKKGVF